MSFIPYQVDYAVLNTAKTLGFSKKRVSFKFGFADRKALAEGLTGPACRGSEHELVFVWSLKTGKRQLLLDNKDLHFSETGQNGWTADRAWQHAFTLHDRVGGTYRVHFVSQPVNREDRNSRPFDLRIGNMSYFEFNPIYQLGTPRMVTGMKSQHNSSTTRNHYGRDSPMSPEERQQLAQAKLESLRDLREQEERQAQKALEKAVAKPEPPLQREEEALISFDDDPTPPAPVASGLPPAASGLGHPVPSTGSAVPAAVPVSNFTSTGSGGSTNYFASSITLDAAIEENQPRQQPGSMFGSNPYAPAAAAATPYGSNPYAAPAPTPTYGAPHQSSSGSYALTPYNPSGTQQQQQQQPYVDATGRLSMGQPQQQQQSQWFATYGGMNSSSGSLNYQGSTGSLNYSSSTTNPYVSPSNQTSYSQMSFGSAPSFAQPPPPPQQQQATAPQYTSGFPPQPPQQQPPSYSAQSYNYY